MYFTTSQILIKSTEPKEILKIRGGGTNINVVGIICPMVEIGLTDLSNAGDAMDPPAPIVPTGLKGTCRCHLSIMYTGFAVHAYRKVILEYMLKNVL